jgi:hypothetical protein
MDLISIDMIYSVMNDMVKIEDCQKKVGRKKAEPYLLCLSVIYMFVFFFIFLFSDSPMSYLLSWLSSR